MTDDTQYLVALDGEMTGPVYGRHAMVALGACMVRVGAVPEVLATFRAYMPVPPDGDPAWYPRTWREFWSATPKDGTRTHVEALRAGAAEHGTQPPAEAMARFWRWLCDVTAPHRGRVRVVSDTAGFDVGWITYYLSMHLPADAPNDGVLEYVTGEYVAVRGLTCHTVGAAGRPLWHDSKGARDAALQGTPMPAACSAVPHDHDPMHDAQNMAMKTAFVNHVLNERFKAAALAAADEMKGIVIAGLFKRKTP